MDLSKIIDKNGVLYTPNSPMLFFLDLTQRCNLKCWFCYNDKSSERIDASKTDLFSIIKIMHDAGCYEVTYLGGEPTIHPNFFEVLDYADSLHMKQSFISNGQIINTQFADKLKKYEGIEVGISLHSHDEKIQNMISGSSRSFEKIKYAIDAMEKSKISWYSQTSLIQSNYNKLAELYNFLLDTGKPLRMDLSRMVEGCIDSNLFLTEDEYITVFESISHLDTDILPIRIESFPRCWLKTIAINKKLDYNKIKRAVRPCYAWIGQISINIYGNVRLCPTGGRVAGNILKNGFDYIWKKSQALNQFRDFKSWQRKECLECDDFAYCVGGCKMTNLFSSPTPDKYIKDGGIFYASNY